MNESYYSERKTKLLRRWDKNSKHLLKVFTLQYDHEFTQKVIPEIRSEFEKLIPQNHM